MSFIVPDLLYDLCPTLVGWTETNNGGGDTNDTDVAGQFHQSVTITNPSNTEIKRTITFPATFTVEIRMKIVSNWSADSSVYAFYLAGEAAVNGNALWFQKDGKIYAYRGDLLQFVLLASNQWVVDTFAIWRIEMTPGNPGSVDIYKDGVLIVNDGVSGSPVGTAHRFTLTLQSNGDANDAYVDYIKIGTGLGEFAPEGDIVVPQGATSIGRTYKVVGY